MIYGLKVFVRGFGDEAGRRKNTQTAETFQLIAGFFVLYCPYFAESAYLWCIE